MADYFVDTNIFLRFLLKDHQTQYPLAVKLFRKADRGKANLWTTDVVILELVWTLKSLYGYDRFTIRENVEGIIALPNLDVLNKKLILQALQDFVNKNIYFADAYNYQLATKAKKRILSFDKDFKKLGVKVDIKKFVR
jgi:predicted nucleic-acid-binding protein